MTAWSALPLALLLALAAPAAAGPRHWLVTPEEAAALGPAQAADPMLPMAGEQPGPGPLIVVKRPERLERLRTPVSMLVEFAPGGSGLAPDTATLTVTLRGFITVDITDRLREYLHKNVLAVEDADLPAGTYRIRMALADTGGNLTVRDLTMAVVDGAGGEGG